MSEKKEGSRVKAWLSNLKWLYPGMKVKRWLLLVMLGSLLMVFGLLIATQERLFSFLEGQIFFLGRWSFGTSTLLGGIMVVVGGCFLLLIGMRKMLLSIVDTVYPDRSVGFAQAVYHQRHLQKGPKIVVIGGGTGLSVLLRGLKSHTSNITAIVTVADDGGSSGRLRTELGILPPGDIRNCMVALADTESLLDQLFQYRFKDGQYLEGHSMGNLLLAAMTNITGGFDHGIKAMSRLLSLRGRVLPATLENVVLSARTGDGRLISGESAIPASGQAISKVSLEPEDCQALPEALEAIREADLIIIGPGSLYTSVLPNLLIKDLANTLKGARGIRAYVCNVMTQPGETTGYGAADHVQAIVEHVGQGIIDHVLVNNEEIPRSLISKYLEQGAEPVTPDTDRLKRMGFQVVPAKLVYKSNLVRHHPDKLSRAVIDLLNEK